LLNTNIIIIIHSAKKRTRSGPIQWTEHCYRYILLLSFQLYIDPEDPDVSTFFLSCKIL